jgi:hypothetical protein
MSVAKPSILAAWGRALVDFLSVAPAMAGAAGIALIALFLVPLSWHLRLTLVLIVLAGLVIYCAHRTKNQFTRAPRESEGTLFGLAPGDLGIIVIALVFTGGGLYLATLSFHVPPQLIARFSTPPAQVQSAAPHSAGAAKKDNSEVNVSIAPARK